MILNKDWLYLQYITNNKSTRDIAREIGCGKKAVNSALRRHGIILSKSGANKNKEWLSTRNFIRQSNVEAHNKLNNKEWLNEHYINKNMSIIEISALCKISKYAVHNWLNRHNIKKPKELQKQCSNRRYEEINGFKISSIDACRKRIKGRRGTKIQTQKGGEIWCHSSWEQIVAAYLDASSKVQSYQKDALNIPYELDGKNHIFIPDFFVKLTNMFHVIIEIKPSKLLETDTRTQKKIESLLKFSKTMGYIPIILEGKSKVNMEPLEMELSRA